MKFNPFKMIDPAMQKMLLGGLVGSLSYYADLVLAEQAFYPAELKARLATMLPRNDELLTSIAPPAIMYMLGKKKPKLKEMAKGTMLYSGPHLMQRIVVNAVTPAATAGLRMNGFSMNAPRPVQVFAQAPTNGRIYPPATSAQAPTMGKYR
jgi:hypothetical protein